LSEKTSGVSFHKEQPTTEVELETAPEKQQLEEDNLTKKQALLSSILSVNNGNLNQDALHENNSMLTSAFHKEFNSFTNAKATTEQTKLFDTMQEDTSSIILVGKVFQTYLLIEKEGSLFIIDQHAAHERILFDKFTEQINTNNLASQGLLVPHIVTVNHLEEAFLKEHLQNINKLGFEVESFGSLSFKVSSIPAALNGLNIDLFFNEILKDMNSLNKQKTSDLITDHLKQASCKAAVKAGNNLSKLEIATLFQKMKEQNTTLLCPHGRPIVVEVTRKEMDKWFKRIL
jgi:DNA mismatch repair protein MutL